MSVMTREKSPKRVLALDFDGVICNSVEECMIVTYFAYQSWRERRLVNTITGRILGSDYRAYFVQHRYLVRPAREYWILMYAYNNGKADLDQKGFEKIGEDHISELQEFEKYFFLTRDQLRTSQYDQWLQWHSLYPECAEAWLPFYEKWTIHIVTTKDWKSLETLLSFFGLQVARERCWTKEHGLRKEVAVQSIAKAHSIPITKIVFVDDHPAYLNDVSQVGAQVFWAGWGYFKDHSEKIPKSYPKLYHLKELHMKGVGSA